LHAIELWHPQIGQNDAVIDLHQFLQCLIRIRERIDMRE
jgi:hypothetical protein